MRAASPTESESSSEEEEEEESTVDHAGKAGYAQSLALMFLNVVLGLRLSPEPSRLVIPLQRLQPSRLCSLGCLQRDSRAVWIHWALQATQHRARDEAKVLHPRLHPRGWRD